VFWFFQRVFSDIFFIVRRTERDVVMNLYVNTRNSCQILTKHPFSWQIFEKYSNIKFNENLSGGSRVVPCGRTDWQTDSHDEANNSFLQFFERSKKKSAQCLEGNSSFRETGVVLPARACEIPCRCSHSSWWAAERNTFTPNYSVTSTAFLIQKKLLHAQ